MRIAALLLISLALVSVTQAFDKPHKPSIHPKKPSIHPKKDDPLFEKGKNHYGGIGTLKPGLKVRISEQLTDMMRRDLAQYGQAYLDFDYTHKKDGEVKINAFPVTLDFFYKNLTHDPVSLDMRLAKLQFTDMAADNEPVIYTRLPMIRKWQYTFDYFFKWLFMPFSGSMKVTAVDADALITYTLKATDKGLLYPQLHDIIVDFGGTNLKCKGFMSFWYKQFFNIGKYISMSAINVFGKNMINRVLPYYSADWLHQQRTFWNTTKPQLEKEANMNLNWRLTADPKIHSHLLDLSFLMDIGVGKNLCTLPHDAVEYEFEDFSPKYNQVILSDRVPNCYLDALEREGWFEYLFSTEIMQQQFGTHGVRINAEYMSAAYPWIGEKYGYDQELDIEFKAISPRVVFGPSSGHDVYFKSDVKFGVKLHNELNYILYDEFFVETEFNMEILREAIFANFKYMTVRPGGVDPGRSGPIYNPEGMAAEEYEEFWSYAKERMNRWLDYFNTEVFGYGVPLPYWNLAFITTMKFHPRAVAVIVDMFYANSYQDIVDNSPNKDEFKYADGDEFEDEF